MTAKEIPDGSETGGVDSVGETLLSQYQTNAPAGWKFQDHKRSRYTWP